MPKSGQKKAAPAPGRKAAGAVAQTRVLEGHETPCSSAKDQRVVLADGFLSAAEIATLSQLSGHRSSIEAGADGKFPGLVGGDRYTDEQGL